MNEIKWEDEEGFNIYDPFSPGFTGPPGPTGMTGSAGLGVYGSAVAPASSAIIFGVDYPKLVGTLVWTNTPFGTGFGLSKKPPFFRRMLWKLLGLEWKEFNNAKNTF